MTQKTKRIKQVLTGLGALLGLSVSALAACACSHHRETPKRAHLCHQAANGPHAVSSETIATSALDEVCVCVPPAAKLSVKSEGFKLKKYPAIFAVATPLQAERFHATRGLVSAILFSPLYRLRFSGAISSRGPPAA